MDVLGKEIYGMLNFSLTEYHFEPYKDFNGDNAIRFRLSGINGNNYSFDYRGDNGIYRFGSVF